MNFKKTFMEWLDSGYSEVLTVGYKQGVDKVSRIDWNICKANIAHFNGYSNDGCWFIDEPYHNVSSNDIKMWAEHLADKNNVNKMLEALAHEDGICVCVYKNKIYKLNANAGTRGKVIYCIE